MASIALGSMLRWLALLCLLAFACTGQRVSVAVDSPSVSVEGRAVLHEEGTGGSYLAFDWSGVNIKLVVTNTHT